MDNNLIRQWEEKLKTINQGTRVNHFAFGPGTVVSKSKSLYDKPLKKGDIPLVVSAQLTVLFDKEQHPRTFSVPLAFVEELLTLI